MDRIVFYFIFIFFWNSLSAQTGLQTAMNELGKDPTLIAGGFSMTVLDVESGEMIANYQKDRGLMPASSLKVVTTSTALALLGHDFKFKTTLEYDGKIDANGTLNGNIYIKGYGDPSLGSDQFDKTLSLDILMSQFVEAIKSKGIKKINGKIIGDASFMGTQVDGRAWLWEDLGNYYGAGAWGLNIHENKYFLTFQRNNQQGSIPEISGVEPHIPNLLHINEVTQADKNSGDNAYIFGSVYNYTRFVRGSIPVGTGNFTIKGAMPDPPFFAAYYLMKKLEAASISTNKEATSLLEWQQTNDDNKKRQLLFTHYSPELAEIVVITNMKSINLYCEAMLRYLGKIKKGEGSPEAGVEVIYDFLKTKGLEWESFFLEDGSGLSPFNTVSSFQMATIMRSIAKDKSLYASLLPSLPVAGKSGALRYMFRGTVAEDKIWAKSGSLKRARSYTGFAKSKSGKLLAFSIICNHYTGEGGVMRDKMERVMLAMTQ